MGVCSTHGHPLGTGHISKCLKLQRNAFMTKIVWAAWVWAPDPTVKSSTLLIKNLISSNIYANPWGVGIVLALVNVEKVDSEGDCNEKANLISTRNYQHIADGLC